MSTPHTKTLNGFRFGVDSTEDVWLYCDRCGPIATGTSTWGTDAIPCCETLLEFVDVAADHECAARLEPERP